MIMVIKSMLDQLFKFLGTQPEIIQIWLQVLFWCICGVFIVYIIGAMFYLANILGILSLFLGVTFIIAFVIKLIQ